MANGHEDAAEDKQEVASESSASTVSVSNTTPKATPVLGGSPPQSGPLGSLAAAYGSEELPWANMGQHHQSSSLAAAQ